jgi:hypothetical protein
MLMHLLDLWEVDGVGGLCQGKAVGNAPAFVDLEQMEVDILQQPKGRVFLHVGEGAMPYSMSHPVGSNLSSVLAGLSKLYSPIKHQNAHISVWDDGIWDLKGHFLNVLRLAEDLPWVKDDMGKWSVTLQAETQPSTLASSEGTVDLLPSVSPSGDSDVLQAQLKALLNIPETLTIWGRSGDLQLAYAKYKAFLEAQSNMQKMMADGTWTLGRVSAETLIELFASKSVWYDKHATLFPLVAKYPRLRKWLDWDEDALSSHEVWGLEKASYSFKDLSVLLKKWDAQTAQRKKKEKEKVREREKGKGKEREREKRMFKESQDRFSDTDSSFKKQKRSKSSHDDDVSM